MYDFCNGICTEQPANEPVLCCRYTNHLFIIFSFTAEKLYGLK